MTHNHRRHIERCLSALLPTLRSQDQVIVVDNGSSDGTAENVSLKFPVVKLLANTDNPGFGAACNQAARSADGEYLVFLNPDTEPMPGWLGALLSALGSIAGAGLATPKLLLQATPELIDSFGHDVHISGVATCRGWGQTSESHHDVEEVAAVSGACFAIRRDLYTRLGGFDERLFLYYEDDDLSLRARLAGFACVAVPMAQVLHDHTPGFSSAKLYFLERNRLWTTLKLYRWKTLLALSPVLLGAEVLGWSMALLSGPRHLLAKARACWSILLWLPYLPRARRQVEHRVPDREVLQLHRAHLAFAQVATGLVACKAERVTAATFGWLAPR